jgi:hypothetical protein
LNYEDFGVSAVHCDDAGYETFALGAIAFGNIMLARELGNLRMILEEGQMAPTHTWGV